MESKSTPSDSGFRTKSLVFLAMNFAYSVFELGFNGIVARLPEGDFSLFWALLKIFFIVTAPLVGVQLVISKEVASYGILGEYGKRRYFVEKTFRYTLALAGIIFTIGMLLSGMIADFLKIESVYPVFLVFTIILLYFPIPFYFGIIQGLKKFYHLGLVQILWGFSRVVAAAVIIFAIAKSVNALFIGIILSIVVTVFVSRLFSKSVYEYKSEPVSGNEFKKAYGLIFPVFCMFLFFNMMKNIDGVFAKRFFTAGEADAYFCAVLVGSSFYLASGLFMVLFPLVSEEKTRGGNPLVFLTKSFQIIIGFSIVGILAAWFAPELLMNIVTLGENMPGSPELIRLIGFAAVPLSLSFILSNYYLAMNTWKFLPVLGGGMLLQILFILLIHETPSAMLSGIIAANTLTFIGMVIYSIYAHRRPVEEK